MTDTPDKTFTAAEAARKLNRLGFNWLDVEFILEFAPHHLESGHMRYPTTELQRFVKRAFWLNEIPIDFEQPLAA